MTVDLIGCYWTLGGAYQFGEHDESPWDFRDRVQAASRAGYTGVGLKHADLMLTLDRYGYDGVRSILADNGIRHLELEALFDWYMDGETRQRSDEIRSDLLTAAEKLGAHHVKAAGKFFGDAPPVDRMTEAFQQLAAEARDAGTVIALEPIAFSQIPDLGTALGVLGGAAGRGGGLMLDIWHVTRSQIAFSAIARLPGRWIACAELADGTAGPVGDPIEDTLDRRRLCGEGEFDIGGFIAAVRSTGYDGPFGVEIIAAEQRRRPLDEAARRSFETTASQFWLAAHDSQVQLAPRSRTEADS